MQAGEFLQDLRRPRIFGMTAADRVSRRSVEPVPDTAKATPLPLRAADSGWPAWNVSYLIQGAPICVQTGASFR
jgi:hypothetical protein